MRAILNGTSNFIISKMDAEGADYHATLKIAQELGLAEADPAMDVDGSDAAQKLAILAHLGFGARVHWSDIPKRGIDDIHACDMAFAKQMGYRVKLIAYAKLVDEANSIQLCVGPMLIKAGEPLAEVQAISMPYQWSVMRLARSFFMAKGLARCPRLQQLSPI